MFIKVLRFIVGLLFIIILIYGLFGCQTINNYTFLEMPTDDQLKRLESILKVDGNFTKLQDDNSTNIKPHTVIITNSINRSTSIPSNITLPTSLIPGL